MTIEAEMRKWCWTCWLVPTLLARGICTRPITSIYPRRCLWCCLFSALGFAVDGCATQPHHKDLLGLFHDGSTTKTEIESQVGKPVIWQDGRIWTYRISRDSDGFFAVREYVHDWTHAPNSLVLEFGSD